MPELGYHYIDCADPDCAGCLPTDAEVAAMSLGEVTRDATRRGLPHMRSRELAAAVLAGADDYRARSAEARAHG